MILGEKFGRPYKIVDFSASVTTPLVIAAFQVVSGPNARRVDEYSI
jgi:hypothetical protein